MVEGGISRRGGASARLEQQVEAAEPPRWSEAESGMPLTGAVA